MAKKRTTKFNYTPTPEEVKSRSLCNDIGIIVYPIPLDNWGNRYRLTRHIPASLRSDNKPSTLTGEAVYDSTKSEWYEQAYKLYVKLKNHYVKN